VSARAWQARRLRSRYRRARRSSAVLRVPGRRWVAFDGEDMISGDRRAVVEWHRRRRRGARLSPAERRRIDRGAALHG
jgi:hypothetical protein